MTRQDDLSAKLKGYKNTFVVHSNTNPYAAVAAMASMLGRGQEFGSYFYFSDRLIPAITNDDSTVIVGADSNTLKVDFKADWASFLRNTGLPACDLQFDESRTLDENTMRYLNAYNRRIPRTVPRTVHESRELSIGAAVMGWMAHPEAGSNNRSSGWFTLKEPMLPADDSKLVQILDAALADAARRSGDWLVCKPGCTQCCMGVFAIHQLDAGRLREGLAALTAADPERAARLRARVRDSVARLAGDFPGDPATGVLDPSEEAEARFDEFANDEPCPVLDPATGLCDLYDFRPVTCRVFGPPVRSGEGLGMCELCYHGASPEQIAACEMTVDPEGLEALLLDEFEQSSGKRGRTLVAFALA